MAAAESATEELKQLAQQLRQVFCQSIEDFGQTVDEVFGDLDENGKQDRIHFMKKKKGKK